MEITWEVEDGYVGKSRPQYTEIYDDDIRECESIKEAVELIEEAVQEDFESKITWGFVDSEISIEEEIRDIMKGYI